MPPASDIPPPLAWLAAELRGLIFPLERAVEDPRFRREWIQSLGSSSGGDAAWADALVQLTAVFEGSIALLSEGRPTDLRGWVELGSKAASLVRDATEISPGPLAALAGDDVLRALMQQLMASWLLRCHPIAFDVLLLLGAIETEPAVWNEARRTLRMPVSRVRGRQLLRLLQDPEAALRHAYEVQPAELLITRLRRLLLHLGVLVRRPDSDRSGDLGALGRLELRHTLLGSIALPAPGPVMYEIETAGDVAEAGDDVDVVALQLMFGLLGDAEQLHGFVLGLSGSLAIEREAAGWAFGFSADTPQFGFGYRRGVGVQAIVDASNGAIAVSFRKLPLAGGGPVFRVGGSAGTRIEVGGLSFRGWAALDGADLGIAAELAGFRVVVSPGDGDSFLASAMSSVAVDVAADVRMAWSLKAGLQFHGALGLQLDIPIGRTIASVLSIEMLHIGLLAELAADSQGASGGLKLELGVDLTLEVGPFVASVAGIGVKGVLEESGRGTHGPVDVRVGFKPPKGIGFAIDSETVKGGGFLELDVDAGRYAGVLELVTPSFGLTALGILNTKIPGDVNGWSLFFALTATFNPPIQLGFGFVLSGVGGLFAVNRRLDEPAMREAVRGGNLDSVLFPTDVVKEAPRIFATVESMFPIAKGSFVFGPMIKIGWGTPPLVEAMVGVFVSLPRPLIIALLGRVRCALPTPENAILVLNMDVAGSINFGAGTVGLDAQIHDSSLFGLELTGAMAFRARFKEQPGFLLSVGGFHPAFEPPADVGRLARMGMSLRLGPQENILVTLGSYFALTSNTLQFGAAIDVSASVSVFKVAGGAYFDALIVYKPFHFTAGMGAYFSVSWGERDLLAVRVKLVLDGPGPWRAQGEASFTIAGFDKSFRFDETFGDKIAVSSDRAPVAAPLREALKEPGNWGVEPGGFTSLRLRDLPANDAGRIIAAPDARVGFRQRVAPLGLKLEQMGPLEPKEPGPFDIQVLEVAGKQPAGLVDLKELFAPAAFLDLTDREKLEAPSFEAMKAGVALGDSWAAPEKAHRYTVEENSFELIGDLWPSDPGPPTLDVVAFIRRARRGADVWKHKTATAVTIEPAGYVCVDVDASEPRDANAVAWHEARAARATGQRIVPAHAVRKVGR